MHRRCANGVLASSRRQAIDIVETFTATGQTTVLARTCITWLRKAVEGRAGRKGNDRLTWRAWLLIQSDQCHAAATGSCYSPRGADCGGTILTPVGEEVIKLYRSIKEVTHMSAHRQRLALASLFASGDRRLFLG
jgi:hypothetical protein